MTYSACHRNSPMFKHGINTLQALSRHFKKGFYNPFHCSLSCDLTFTLYVGLFVLFIEGLVSNVVLAPCVECYAIGLFRIDPRAALEYEPCLVCIFLRPNHSTFKHFSLYPTSMMMMMAGWDGAMSDHSLYIQLGQQDNWFFTTPKLSTYSQEFHICSHHVYGNPVV